MSNPYRAMCKELLAALKIEGYVHWIISPDEDELCIRADALLAQPEPEGLTDEVLLQMLFDNYREDIEFLCNTEEEAHLMIRSHVKFASAAIAADRARTLLAQPELPELTDQEIASAAREALDSYRYSTELSYFLEEHASEHEPIMLAFRAVIAADRARRIP
jgi:hypothetical protein